MLQALPEITVSSPSKVSTKTPVVSATVALTLASACCQLPDES
jgi:hypothetical protein